MLRLTGLIVLAAVMTLAGCTPQPSLEDTASQSMKRHCNIEWPTDDRMYRYCLERQIAGRADVNRLTSQFAEDELSMAAAEHCRREWSTDHAMRSHCIKREFQSRADIARLIEMGANETIVEICADRWLPQLTMVEHCIKRGRN